MLYTGVVENRQDPLQLGRCQVRIVGLHTHDKAQLPTEQLPWATPLQAVSSAAMNGIGLTPIGPVEGTTVIISFMDHDQQIPVILGTLGGIPTAPKAIEDDDSVLPIDGEPRTKDIVLRTVVGPTTGKQITFYDPEEGKTNLTNGLKANMKVVGFGMSDNCFIVSVDSPTQITISEVVTGYGENIITFKDAPTNLSAVTQSKLTGVLTDSNGKPILDGSGTPVKQEAAQPSADVGATPVQNSTNTSIPTIPPPKESPNASKSSEGIKALIAACDKVGLTTKEQKCALLGIAGGESRWIPQNESYNYSKSRIKQIFSFLTDEEAEKYSDASKKGITREQFFQVIYGPTKRGKGFLGNQTDEDGGKYYGRGFIQLTGKANYKRYQDMANKLGLNLDLINNPDSLDNDINVSALVAALYIKDRVPAGTKPTDHPGYFYSAKKAVGVNSPDIAAKKLAYYEYFYGTQATGSVDKDAGAPPASPPADFNGTPGPSADSVKRGTDNTGFRDPNNKYPLKDYINEPDTNRLARGIIEGTVVEKKDANVKKGIPKAYDSGSWDQPMPAFGAKYPFNKVYETESGHIQEFDDTPGQERIHTYHRSGTYSEIDANGTQVNYIVGDSFTLMERNGCIHVAGECNITVEGNTNIFARTDANIEVSQNANIRVGNNVDLGVANDMYIATGGDFLVKTGGTFKVQANDVSVLADADLTMQGTGAVSVKGDTVNVESAGSMDLLAGGTLSADYAQGQFGNGASGATDVSPVELTPPAAGEPQNPVVPYLIPPERQSEELAANETPDDYNTPEGRRASKEQEAAGVPGAPAPVATEEATATGGVAGKNVPVDCKIIYTTKNFTNDYTISKNFSLGMLIDGGVNGKHKLVDQILKESPSSGERVFTVQEIVCNLAMSAQNILEPYLEVMPGGISGFNKQWKVSSGYRLKGVVPTESPFSDHCKGHCFDIALLLPDRINKTYQLVQQCEKIVKYDQIILEYRYPESVWIHTGYKPQGNRSMAFTMVNDSTYKRDAKGNPAGFFLVDPIPPKAKKV
jgi:predicted chitinase